MFICPGSLGWHQASQWPGFCVLRNQGLAASPCTWGPKLAGRSILTVSLWRRKLSPRQVEWLAQSPQLIELGLGFFSLSGLLPNFSIWLHTLGVLGTAVVGGCPYSAVSSGEPQQHPRGGEEREFRALIPRHPLPCRVLAVWLHPSAEPRFLSGGPLHSEHFRASPCLIRPSSGMNCCCWSSFLRPFVGPDLIFEKNLFIKCSSNRPV